jgi:hypothetical protein
MLLKPAWQKSIDVPSAQTCPVPEQVWNMPPPLPPLLLLPLLLPPIPGGVTPPPLLPLTALPPQSLEQEVISQELTLRTHCWQLAERLVEHPW